MFDEKRIIQIDIITQSGAKTLQKKYDFDKIEVHQIGYQRNEFIYDLYKNGILVYTISGNVPLCIQYKEGDYIED